MEATDFSDSSRAEGQTERNEFLYDVLTTEREKAGGKRQAEKAKSTCTLILSSPSLFLFLFFCDFHILKVERTEAILSAAARPAASHDGNRRSRRGRSVKQFLPAHITSCTLARVHSYCMYYVSAIAGGRPAEAAAAWTERREGEEVCSCLASGER